MTAGYYRFPTIHKNTVVFASEDDLWSVSASGGTARRLTSNLGEVTNPILSPNGKLLAFEGRDEGPSEVYVMPAEGGSARRLTFLGSLCRVVGWNPKGTHILFCSSYGQITFGSMALFQIAADSVNGEVEELPYGPVRSVAFGPSGQLVLGRNGGDPARWKRYRGGTAGHLWIRNKNPKKGVGNFEQLLPDLNGNIASPMWLVVKNRNRIFFVSDHEGIANLYSCTPKGKDLRRHTDHEEYFVRFPHSDGQRIVYHAGADIYIYDIATDSSKLLKIKYLSPRVQRNRKFVGSWSSLESADFYPNGKAVTIIARGKPFTFYHQDGPSYQHGERDGIRYRRPTWFNDGERLLMVSDKLGEELFEIHYMDLDKEPLVLEGLDIGRPVICKMSPHADKLAMTNHRHELIVIDLEGVGKENDEDDDQDQAQNTSTKIADAEQQKSKSSKKEHSANEASKKNGATNEAVEGEGTKITAPTLTVVDRSPHNRIAGFDWSPDGNWIAYDHSATNQTSAIRLYRLPAPEAEDEKLHQGEIFTITQPVLQDLMPSFDPEGKYLYFVSRREFNPTYDGLHFEIGFPMGMRPYLVTLQADLPNPFIPRPDDEPPADAGNDEEDEDTQESDEDEDVDEGVGDDGEDSGDDDKEENEEDDDSAEDASEESGDAIAADESGGGTSTAAAETDADETDQTGGDQKAESEADGDKATETDASTQDEKKDEKPKIQIDIEGIERRVMAFPVPEGRYGQIAGVFGKAVFMVYPNPTGVMGNQRWEDEPYQGATLRAYDFKEYRSDLLADRVGGFKLSTDRKKLLYYSGGRVRIINAGEKAPPNSGGNVRKSGWVDMSRVRISVDRPGEWHQMLREAWRLQRDHFWTENMSGIDWVKVYERYRPLVDRISTRSELSDIIWEMQGELGTSHAYEWGGDYRYRPYYGQGFLGATFKWNAEEGGYELGEPVVGDPWDPYATSPLAGPGIDAKAGDILVAINGQRVDEETSPAQLLVNYAWIEVLLTFKNRTEDDPDVQNTSNKPASDKQAGEKQTDSVDKTSNEKGDKSEGKIEEQAKSEQKVSPYRNVSVKTMFFETPAYYRRWVENNRRAVHEATNGRIGYVHIPDMGAYGYAEFHRGFLAEVDRDGLIIDVRYNGGGHVSQLILEKLARRRVGFDVSRWGQPSPYPNESVAGPMVALTNELAGSDGDIFCHCFKLMKLGPLVGKRTWGGVIGIAPKQALVDGSLTTQPEYSFWFKDIGWGVENYGTDPDIEVDYAPQDYASDEDPQLARAIEEASKLLKKAKILKPDLENLPNLALPKLPPRNSGRKKSKKK